MYHRIHSSLQSEFRLTQKIVRKSRQRSKLRYETPQRSFHQSRNLRSSQGARNDGNPHPPSPPPAENQTDSKDRSITPEVPDSFKPSPLAPKIAAAQGGPPSEDANSVFNGFHGSLRNRVMRVRAAKESPKPQIDIPSWFIEDNVTLLGQGELGSGATTSIEYLPKEGNFDLLKLGRMKDDISAQDHSSESSQYNGRSLNDVENIPTVAEPSSCYEHPTTYPKRRRNPQKEPRYRLQTLQHLETQMTASGLMFPSRKPEYDGEPANTTAHLCLRYAAPDGELLLDDYVQNLAVTLGCDLVTVDVQDIAELIATSHQPPNIVADARHMTYEVLRTVEPTAEMSYNAPFPDEGDEEMDEDSDAFDSNPMGGDPKMPMPMIMGKPFAIDLGNISDILAGKLPSHLSTYLPRSPAALKISERKGTTTDVADESRFSATIMTDLVERLLALVGEKRAKSTSAEGLREPNQHKHSAKARIMIQIKELKAIQYTSIGSRFLSELYAQVQKQRINGESIILVGTECSHRDDATLSARQIESMQRLRNEEISRTIVLTPVVNDVAAKLNLRQDSRLRIATINMRHIFQSMSLKQMNTRYFDLLPGFWRTDEWLGVPKHVWASTDLGKTVLNFSEVHRITIMLAGLSSGSYDMSVDLKPVERANDLAWEIVNHVLHESDASKTKWANSQVSSKKLQLLAPLSVEDAKIAKIRSSATRHEKKLLSGVIEPSKILTTFADVHAPIETIDALQTLTTLSLIRPEAFSYGVLASDRIPGLLLYGPPGTGKTLLAKAVAKESGARVLEVSAADLNDMYVGEGEKNIKALFSLARKLSPCVVFLDEADAMFSARANSGKRVSHRELLNQFLKEWDGMSNDSGSAFIMVATNRPMDLDDAVLRRLPRRLLVDLPTEQDRYEILKIHLRNEQLAEDVELDNLAKKTPFYSGSDLKNLAVAAALNAVKEENEDAKQHKLKQAEHQQEASGVTETQEPVEHRYPDKRTLTAKHFEIALEEITASISEDMSSLKDIKKFDEQYGDKRGKRKKKPMWGFKGVAEADKVIDTVKVRNA